jgi:hypothetical protein
MKNKKTKPHYNDYLEIIDAEIAKRRYKWNLNSLPWMDFDDVSQIIRIHIFNKWAQYDPARPIQPWLNAVISSQIKNLIRNHYGNYARPCLRCDAAEDNEGCKIYKKQCDSCPLYADWKKRKLPAHNIKLPVSIENHTDEVHSIFDENSDITDQIEKINIKMKEILKPIEYKVYEGLFILHEDEGQVAKKLGYISNERGRPPGYKQIKNIRKSIILKIKKCISSGDIDLF